MGIRFDESTLTAVNKRLENAGATIKVTPELLKPITDILPKWVNIDINPNQVEQTKLDNAIAGKVMHAEILPLADKLKTAVIDTLKDLQIPLNGLTIPPGAISTAVSNALSSANFTSVGDKAGEELSKAIKVKVEGQPYNITLTPDVGKLAKMVNDALDKIFNKEQKVKLDRTDIKAFREELKKQIGEAVKITPTLNLTQETLQKAVEGKVMRIEVLPLISKLRQELKNATTQSPVEMEAGINETKLRQIITNILKSPGYMLTINTIDDQFTKKIQTTINAKRYDLTLTIDPNKIAQSINASLQQVQGKSFGLQVTKSVLYQSIDDALKGHPFPIQVKVDTNQIRQSVQSAINNATGGKPLNFGNQTTQTNKAATAVDNLAKAHRRASSAGSEHARVSTNLGSVLGSNIRVAGELGSVFASLYSIHAAKEFLSQVIEIGGELEHQKIALETIYGTGSKMESLYGQIKSLARQSPFGVMELTKNVKQLSAYGVAYNEVYDTAKRLADISAATSVDIQRLILAFGKTKNRTFLDGLEAKQFAYANIPIYDMLSKKLTELEGKFVSVKDVMGRIKKREIGFDMVKDILWDMTDEGGKFYNMQEKLAGSVKTSWKLVKDNIELMFGEIAEGKAGTGLKNLGEILQKLTREWKTIGAVMGAGVAAFGIYKIAVLATNAVLAKHNVELLKSTAAQNKETLAKTVGATIYRKLNSEERRALNIKQGLAIANSKNIFSTKQLTMAQIASLHQEKALTKDMALRLIATKRINAADIQYLVQQKIITQAEAQRALSVSGLAARFKLLGASIWTSVKAAAAFVFNPVTLGLAALGAGVTLWQRNSQEMEKNKEIGKGVFNKAVDSAKELKDMLSTIGMSEGLSSLELSQGIEQMESKIKDLSPTPIEDINNSLVAQDGHVRTLTERFDFLKGRIEELSKAYNLAISANYNDKIQGALDATDGSNWFTQLFNDDLITNATDYTNALKRRENAIAKVIAQNKQAMVSGIDAAIKSDAAFREATKGIETYDEKLRFLIENYYKFSSAAAAFDATTSRFDDIKTLDKIGNFGQINDAYDELLADTDRFIADLNARLNLNPLTMTEEQKLSLTMSLKHILDSMESAGDDAKAVIAKKWEEAWNIVLMEDKIGPAMSAKFKTMMDNSAEEGNEVLLKKLIYEGFDKLDKEEQKRVLEMMQKARDITQKELSLTNEEMASYLASHPLEQLIQLVYTTSNDAPSELAKELVAKHGYPGLTNSTDRFVKQWTKSGKMYESRNAAKEALQAVYSELEAAKKEGGEVQKRAQAAYDEVWQALQYLGWTDLEVKDQKSNKHTGSKSKKDAVAENLKQRFKDIKDAWSEFSKWSKVEGREAAANRIGESGLFSTLAKEDIPKTVEEYRALVVKLEDELKAAGIAGHSQRESLLNDILKQLLDIDKTVVDEQLKLAFDAVSKEAERQLADWNLFDKIRKATGNQDLAMSVAFGLNADAETDYPTLVKNQFNEFAKAAKSTLTFDTATPEKLKDAPEEVQKAWEDATKKLEQYARQQKDAIESILTEYQSLSDKLTKIDSDRQRKIDVVNQSTMKEPEKAVLRQRINVEADYQKFQQSADYLKFFSGIYSLTMDQAQQIGDKIRLHLDQRLQAGKISAEEYYKEIERINQQLSKLRNVKSDALTFATSGIKGLQSKQLEKADADVLAQMTKVKEAEEALIKAKAKGNEQEILAAESALSLAKQSLKTYESIRDAIIKNQEGWQNTLDIVNIIANITQGISDSFNSIKDMADSLGFDTENNDWLNIGGIVDTLSSVTSGVSKAIQSAMNGDIGGILSGVVSTITSPFTIWAQIHDKKLQKMIERSKEYSEQLQSINDKIERRMANFLGNGRNLRVLDAENDIKDLEKLNKLSQKSYLFAAATQKEREKLAKRQGAYAEGGAYGYQRQLMTEQLTELEKQRQLELDKKKSDSSVVADYEDQIDEMKIQIRDFAIEVAQDLYGIDLNGWAEQLGDALVDAFAAGEDAAEAFNKTVGDIMRDVTSKMISQDILAPMFGDLRDFLFGSDGMSGAFGADFKLDPSEMGAMKEYLDKIKNEGIPAAQDLFDAINAATGGVLNDTEKSKSGLSAGIQSITEDTADLLASYVNAIRADVAMSRLNWDKLLESALPQMNIIAEAQLTAQRQIAENTLRNAIAAEMIYKAMGTVTSNQERLERSWRRIAEKNWGTY